MINQTMVASEILSPPERKQLFGFFEEYVDDVLKKLRKQFKEPIPTNDT